MNFAERANMADNTEFQRRVRQALIKVAVQVRADAPDHVAYGDRQRYANAVLQAPAVEAARMAQGVVANPGIGGEPTDADIEFTVASLFTTYSGHVDRPELTPVSAEPTP